MYFCNPTAFRTFHNMYTNWTPNTPFSVLPYCSPSRNLYIVLKSLALRNGLIFAWTQGVRKLLCETDCQELTRVLTDSTRVMCKDHSRVLCEIKELIERHWQVWVSWVPREANAVADWLTKQGLRSRVQELVDVPTPSPDLQVLLLKDFLGV